MVILFILIGVALIVGAVLKNKSYKSKNVDSKDKQAPIIMVILAIASMLISVLFALTSNVETILYEGEATVVEASRSKHTSYGANSVTGVMKNTSKSAYVRISTPVGDAIFEGSDELYDENFISDEEVEIVITEVQNKYFKSINSIKLERKD